MNLLQTSIPRGALVPLLALCLCAATLRLTGAEADDVARQLQELKEQNHALQEKLLQQDSLIKKLTDRMSELEQKQDKAESPATDAVASARPTESGLFTRNFSTDRVIFSGEAAVGLFHQGNQGQFRTSPFRIDEARLFLDAKVFNDVYFFSELNLFTREQYDDSLHLGELYVDFENVSKLWNKDGLLSVRVGRIDIPFGEEYLVRDAIDNPLISHSLGDLWGVDEGVEIYGRWKKLQYVVAVQNGGEPMMLDGNADKAIVARIGYDPAKWLHLSLSGMRTGDLDVKKDGTSELWFANGYIRQLGSPTNTTKFHAEVAEGDVQVSWPRGHLKSAGGYLRFDDNDRTTDNGRNLYYYYVEGLQQVNDKIYGAVRFSQIMAPGGFPLVGAGDFGTRFYGALTKDLYRMSVGAGYRWSRDLVFKVEYSLNRGRELGGKSRNHEDFFGTEIAVRY